MDKGVFVKNYAAPPVNEQEALRYGGGGKNADERLYALLKECLRDSEKEFSYRLCYRVFTAQEAIDLFKEYGGVEKRLCKAEYAVAFAATVGVGIDRLVARYAQTSPAKALLLQGLGAERIESLCDVFCRELKAACQKRGLQTGTRFSPGYGAFDLSAQRKMVSLLDCSRKIGLTLTDSLLLSPTKSVTAIVGIGKEEKQSLSCAACEKTDCAFREDGR